MKMQIGPMWDFVELIGRIVSDTTHPSIHSIAMISQTTLPFATANVMTIEPMVKDLDPWNSTDLN
jgi:hypothetical protein